MGVELGILIGFVLTALIGLPIFLYRNSSSYHDKYHTHYSELMCDHCARRRRNSTPGESYRRWPLRVFGETPPRGEG